MDLGSVGLDGLVCSDSGFASSLFSESETKQKFGSVGFFKQERSGTITDDEWRDLKVAKTTDDFSDSKDLLLQLRNPLLRPNSSLASDGQQMLSFSLPDSQLAALPHYFQKPAANCRNTGYGFGNLNAASMHGVLTRFRGPLTPSQRMELEHQALIYRYISSNVPIPSHLLIPIRKALDSAGLSSFSGLSSNALGWGAFHLGFPSSCDPEPGRCRRTDGKKWRCSKDAVPDQKYCERHMNRGRHRSRKPVEGHASHSVTTTTRPTIATSANLITVSSSSNSLTFPQHPQSSNLQTGAVDTSASLYRGLMDKENVVETEARNSLHQFMEEWPKNQTEGSAISWPSIERTQLSISIPTASSDIMSCSSSPTNKTFASSAGMKSSRELEQTQMGLGVGNIHPNEMKQRQENWIPISWGRTSSMGGPLGEVFQSTNNNNSTSGDSCKSTSALNLMTEGWDSSPRLASSPTGVLQRTGFLSVSNSSAGSRPRTTKKTVEVVFPSCCRE